jgi:hypothetical protein
METFIYFLMCSWGLTHILVSSKILSSFRDYLLISYPTVGELLNCYQCTGFWVSLFLTPLFGINFGLTVNEANFLVGGFIGSGFCSVFSYLVSFLIKRNSK